MRAESELTYYYMINHVLVIVEMQISLDVKHNPLKRRLSYITWGIATTIVTEIVIKWSSFLWLLNWHDYLNPTLWEDCFVGLEVPALPDSILGASMFWTRVRHIWLTGSAWCNQEAGGNSVCLVFQKGRGVRYFVKEYLLCFSSFQIVFNVYLRYNQCCQRVRRWVHDVLTRLLVMQCDEAHALWD